MRHKVPIDLHNLGAQFPQGAFSSFDMETIYPYLVELKPKDVYLEVGVDQGLSLAYARYISKAEVYGVDIADKLDRSYFEGKKVLFNDLGSDIAVQTWTEPISLLFIDGDHSFEGCLKDFNNFSPFVKSGGHIFFHDCDESSPGVMGVFHGVVKNNLDYTDFIVYKEMPGFNTSMASCRKL